MEKFISKLEKYLLPVAEKLNGQRHLASLRDGFIATMPLLIIGAFAIMFKNVVFNISEGSLLVSLGIVNAVDPANYPIWMTNINLVLDNIYNGSLAITALLVVYTIAFNLTEIKGYKGVEAGVLSLAAFFIAVPFMMEVPISEGGELISVMAINPSFFGPANIITAILIAFFVSEVYTYFLKREITIKMPSEVPPAVGRSFAALLPGAFILVVIAILQMLFTTEIISFGTYTFDSISSFIQLIIGAPLRIVGGGYFGLMVYATMVNVFWFFGIHGPNTLAFMDQSIFSPAAVQNAVLIQQGIVDFSGNILNQAAYDNLSTVELPSIYTKTLVDSYVFLGGSGATLGLIIALLLASKNEANKKIAKYSFTPALFNINEPLLFGLPIVFNPILFIPFILIQPILVTTATLAINFGLIPMYGITIPWTSPVGLGAFLGYGGSFTAMAFAFFQLALSTLLYYPFVVAMNRIHLNKNEKEGE